MKQTQERNNANKLYEKKNGWRNKLNFPFFMSFRICVVFIGFHHIHIINLLWLLLLVHIIVNKLCLFMILKWFLCFFLLCFVHTNAFYTIYRQCLKNIKYVYVHQNYYYFIFLCNLTRLIQYKRKKKWNKNNKNSSRNHLPWFVSRFACCSFRNTCFSFCFSYWNWKSRRAFLSIFIFMLTSKSFYYSCHRLQIIRFFFHVSSIWYAYVIS